MLFNQNIQNDCVNWKFRENIRIRTLVSFKTSMMFYPKYFWNMYLFSSRAFCYWKTSCIFSLQNFNNSQYLLLLEWGTTTKTIGIEVHLALDVFRWIPKLNCTSKRKVPGAENINKIKLLLFSSILTVDSLEDDSWDILSLIYHKKVKLPRVSDE